MVNMHPRTVGEALCALSAPHAVPVAGATDWLLRRGPEDVPVFLDRIPELQTIAETDEGVRIGAMVTMARLAEDARVPAALRKAASGVAAPAVRNMATLGGNLVNASPAGDTLPALYALDARVRTEGPAGMRDVPAADFILGVRKTALLPGELVTEIQIPRLTGLWFYEKVGGRDAQAISKCSLCAVAAARNGRVTLLRAAFGAVGRTVVRCPDIEKTLFGLTGPELEARIPEVLSAYGAALHPIDDQRSTADYRRQVCLRLLGTFLAQCARELCRRNEDQPDA